MPPPSICQYVWLGAVDYLEARARQLALVEQVHGGAQPNTLLLLEHPHVYTRGRLSQASHVLRSEDELAKLGIPVRETDRGGQVTYHGPGQLVGYPIVNLRNWGGPLKYVRTLEQVIIGALSDLGVAAHTEEGLTGVWTDAGKIAAIGVKVSRGIAFHGFAININTDLTYYQNIVPCGIEDRPVTSVQQVLGTAVDMEMARYAVVYQFGKHMGFRMATAEAGSALDPTAAR